MQRYVEEVCFTIGHRNDLEEIKQNLKYLIANRKVGESLDILVCFNPSAGSNSRSHLDNVLQFIKKTNLNPEVFTTQKRDHCKEHLRTLDPSKYCAVAIVSGDGLMH